MPELTVTVDNVPHRPVLGQVVRAIVIEVDGLLTGRTRQRIRTGHDRRERDAAHVGRAQVAVRPAVAHHAAVRLAEDGQLVRLRMVVGRVRLGCAAAAGSRVSAVLLLLLAGRLQRPLRVDRTVKAQCMVARQQHRIVEQLLAGDTVQFVFHRGGTLRSGETIKSRSMVYQNWRGLDRRRRVDR